MRPLASEAEPEAGATRSSPHSPRAPVVDVAGRGELRLLELIGSGSSSQVWRAVEPTGRIVALKILKPELRERSGAADFLAHEHAVLAELRHPHIVTTFGLTQHRGAPALVLEYLGGGDLVALAGSHPRRWIDAVRAVLSALTHLHSRGFVHRDLKARNVLFDDRDRARLVDFASSLPIGAPAPRGGTTAEYARAAQQRTAAPSSDCWAFAVLIYELLAGRLPFAEREPVAGAAGPLWPLRPPAEPAAEALADLVTAHLAADGRDSRGLSAFADVIEFAVASYR